MQISQRYIRTNHEMTALQAAAYGGNIELVKWLVDEEGTDIAVRDQYARTALHYAAMGGSIEVVKWLVDKKGADVEAGSALGTPTSIVKGHNQYAVAEWLGSVRGITSVGSILNVAQIAIK